MLDKFLAFQKENNLIQKGDSILTGVSGGVDSVVLLDILSKLQGNLGIQIATAHVNYGLRKESDKDEKFVRDLAKKYDVPFFEKEVKLAGGNIEEKARDIRYSFFNEVALANNFNKIAVAHHKNDLVETFFLNLSRGSGLTGLVSMQPKNGSLIRPFLFATRKEIEGYAKKNRLKFVEDVTNKDLKFKRNLIRHKIIPELEKTSPDLVETVATEIEDLREVQSLVMEAVTKYYKELAREENGLVSFTVKELSRVDTYLQTEILRKAIHVVKGDLRDISRKNIEDTLKLADKTYGTKEVHIGEGLIVRRTYDRLEIRKEAKSPLEKPKSLKLKMGEEAFFGKWRLFLRETTKKTHTESKNLVFLDIQKTPTLHVRCRQAGDRIELGRGKTKSLQDLFVDSKIPRSERDIYPVVANASNEVVWVPGVRVSSKYKLDNKIKDLISLEAVEKNEKTN